MQLLTHKLRAGKVQAPVQAQLEAMAVCVTSYNFSGALDVCKALTDQYWRDHNDWLAKLKFLLVICHKKYQS